MKLEILEKRNLLEKQIRKKQIKKLKYFILNLVNTSATMQHKSVSILSSLLNLTKAQGMTKSALM